MNTVDTTFQPPLLWVAEQLGRISRAGVRRAVVLVASERHAHALRRYLCVERRAPDLAAGVLFMRAATLANEILIAAGSSPPPIAEGGQRRRLRLLELFLSSALDRRLRYFDSQQLRSSLGYATAFARAIHDLEASQLNAEQLLSLVPALEADDESDARRLHDVALAWRQADGDPNAPWSSDRVLMAAADLLRDDPEPATAFGPVLAVLTNSPSMTFVDFLDALPDCSVVLQDARPWRTHAQRWRDRIALALPEEPASDSGEPRELDILQRFLFELPEVLTDATRLRSCQPDDSVSIEQYASVDEEVEAAASWVAEQVAEGVALERIALVVAEPAAYIPLLVDRLARLRTGEGGIPVHVAGGVPLGSTVPGKRLLRVLTALAASLSAETVIGLLPLLRRRGQSSEPVEGRVTPSAAADAVFAAGIVGGSARSPAGITEWVPRLRAYAEKASEAKALADAMEEAPPENGLLRRQVKMRGDAAQRWLRLIEPLLPAVEALQDLGERVARNATLADLWPPFADFCQEYVALPPEPPGLLPALRARLASVVSDPSSRGIDGRNALDVLAAIVAEESHSLRRFGSPAVFLGAPAQAAGLPFDAVRVLGLAEGGLPGSVHDDPIVPDRLRARIEAAARERDDDVVVPRLSDLVLDEIHDIFRVIQAPTRALALSMPRQWTDRGEREVSGVLLEAATALGRGSAIDGEGDVPTASRLRAAYFECDVRRRQAARSSMQATPKTTLDRVAGGERAADRRLSVPSGWDAGVGVQLSRTIELMRRDLVVALKVDGGLLGSEWARVDAPGLGRKPISATTMTLLLNCPHRFLLERVLHRRPPSPAPSIDRIDPATYGQLFHAAAQRFFQEHGEALCRRETPAEELIAQAREIGASELAAARERLSLRGEDTIEREQERLLRQLEWMVRDEWQRPKREFVAAESSFGEQGGIRLLAGDVEMRVWGAIDRIDRPGPGELSVRDLKTGMVRDLNDEQINPARDLQLGLYVLALEQTAGEQGSGERVVEAAYVHPSVTGDTDRTFTGPALERLRGHTAEWIEVAESLLRTGNLVHTPNADDCRQCPFVTACGEDAHRRTAGDLQRLPAAHELERFARLKAQLREG